MMMTKQFGCFVILACLGISQPVAASAAAIGITPAAQTVSPGSTFQVNATISRLTTSRVGDFDLTMNFDPAILQVVGVSFGSFLGFPSSLQSFTLGTDHVEFAEVSLLAPSALVALQPQTFTPATLTFQAIGLGTSALSFTAITAGDENGSSLGLTRVVEASW
jgi:C4-dicarboxylate transporter